MVSESVANRSRRGVRAAVETPRLVATMFGPMFWQTTHYSYTPADGRAARALCGGDSESLTNLRS